MTVRYYTEHGLLDSTALSYYWYDFETGDLFVKFRAGNVAGYANVPNAVVRAFVTASSVGSYYTNNIKGVYRGLNSDVTLQKREDKPVVKQQVFQVTYSATFTSEIKAASLEDAIQQLKDAAESANASDVTVKSATINFD